jgi:hypothetical protein
MGQFNLAKLFGMTIRESANDGSDFTNPDADFRRLFLGEDGLLHVKDSSGTVTNPFSGGTTITTGSAVLGGDVTMTSANTDYDGPSSSLAAGTYYIAWKALFQVVTTTATYRVKLWDGSTIYDESEDTGNSPGYRYTYAGFAVVVLGSTTTVKITAQSDVAAQVMKRNGGVGTIHRGSAYTYLKIA